MKVSTEKNTADLFTKPLTRPRVAYLLRGLGYVYAEGRAERAPLLEVDTAAISMASPMLALTVLAMQIGRASGAGAATADEVESSSLWLWITMFLSVLFSKNSCLCKAIVFLILLDLVKR